MAHALEPPAEGTLPEGAITHADICTSCGLCCSGALFLYGKLDAAEIPLADSLGLKRWDDAELPAIAFPCPAVVGRCCTVYEDRPQVCRKYSCEVLNNVDRGVLTGERAIEIVIEGVALAAAANDGYPADIWQQRRDHLANPEGWRDGPPETLADRLRRRLALYTMERFLDTYFRRPHQRQVTLAPEDGSAAQTEENMGADLDQEDQAPVPVFSRPSGSGRPAASPLG